MVIRYNMGWYEMLLIDVPLFFRGDRVRWPTSTWSCQRELHDDWLTRRRDNLPFLMSIGIGLTGQQHEGPSSRRSSTSRPSSSGPPKYRIEGARRRVDWQESTGRACSSSR